MAMLDNSTRTLAKATYTPLDLPRDGNQLGRAHDKAQLLRSLQLRPGEVDAIRARLRNQPDRQRPAIGEAVWRAANRFEPNPVGILQPQAAELADLPTEHLLALGRAVLAARSEQLTTLRSEGADAGQLHQKPGAGVAAAEHKSLVTYAHNAVNAFANAVAVSPIGMLSLERVEMAPAGIERGELLATIPLAPGEQTSVVQKEWTVTNSEFSSIVTDELVNYSEKGVTEKSELADATQSETKHSQQLGLDASVSGSYGFVTFATSAKFATSVDNQESVKASRTHAAEVTAKAATRARKERKVTIQSTTETGQQETTTRTLTNPSSTDPMRIDYYSMMRKWRVRLLQYGLRLTYDIAIPEPGATLRRQLAELSQLDELMTQQFTFGDKPTDITPKNYEDKAAQYGVSVPPPPRAEEKRPYGGTVPNLGKDTGWRFTQVDIDVPEGYRIDKVHIEAKLGVTEGHGRTFVIIGINPPLWPSDNSPGDYDQDLPGFLANGTGRQTISYLLQDVDTASVVFEVTMVPTDEQMAAWRMQVWQALHDAARDSFYAWMQTQAAKREALRAQLGDVDTLTLRQEEREEVMKGVLRWLLGPAFDFMPQDVRALFAANGGSAGLAFTGSELALDPSGWATMFQYQEMVKFLQQAIEWENLLYFCYPYFWDIPDAWDFVRTLRHPDPLRQQFLRSGSARVVLTVRPGYEEAFAAFIDRGSFGDVLPPNHPYLTIGQEIRAYDQANYPGIPPANPAGDYRPLLSPLQKRAWQELQAIIGLLDQYHANEGAYPTTAQGLAALSALGTVPAADPWGHPYSYTSPGKRTDYEVASMGADGKPGGDGDDADITSWAPASLIAEWFEYTPSHGTDIQVNTSIPVMA
jgi:hypothetical protein